MHVFLHFPPCRILSHMLQYVCASDNTMCDTFVQKRCVTVVRCIAGLCCYCAAHMLLAALPIWRLAFGQCTAGQPPFVCAACLSC